MHEVYPNLGARISANEFRLHLRLSGNKHHNFTF
jgi:hypothetical protein